MTALPRQVSQHLELLGQFWRQLLADKLLTRERRERLARPPGSGRGNIQMCGDLVRQPAHPATPPLIFHILHKYSRSVATESALPSSAITAALSLPSNCKYTLYGLRTFAGRNQSRSILQIRCVLESFPALANPYVETQQSAFMPPDGWMARH